MPRTISSNSTTEKNKVTGAFPRYVLEVEWSGGTEYYGAEAFSGSGVPTIQARVSDFGSVQLSAIPGQSHGLGQTTVQLVDTDLALKAKFETAPGPQAVIAYVSIYFDGTAWADRIRLYGGILTSPFRWNERRMTWSVTMKDLGHHFDTDVGFLLNKVDFPEVACNQCENQVIPIVYGSPCYRVPACVIDRPGFAFLADTLEILDGYMTINVAAATPGNFDIGTEITLAVGWPNLFEVVKGTFATSTSVIFNFGPPLAGHGRQALETSGTTSVYAEGGQQYVTLPKSAFADWSEQRTGRIVFLEQKDGSFRANMVTYWEGHGDHVIAFLKAGNDSNLAASFYITSTVGWHPTWPIGTPVYEVGDYTYVANFLPSESVDHVEVRGEVPTGSGSQTRSLFFEIDPTYYTVNLDNRTWNTQLGRLASDDGVTTVTISISPVQLGFESENLFISMKGVKSSGGTAITDPAEIIESLLTNQHIGNIDSALLDSTSFTAASSAIPEQMAFAVLDRVRLNELVHDVAMQAFCILHWDQGTCTIKRVENSAGTSQMTITRSNSKDLLVEETDVKRITNEMWGRFKLALPAPDITIVRKSQDAIDDFGRLREEMNLWTYQDPSDVSDIVESFLTYRLRRNRRVTFTAFLDAIHLQPGDWITLDVDNGEGVAVFDTVSARVITVEHNTASNRGRRMPEVRVTADVQLFTYAVTSGSASSEDCLSGRRDGDTSTSGRRDARKRYVRSDGIESMYVWDAASVYVRGGGDNIGSDSLGPVTVGPGLNLTPPATPPPPAFPSPPGGGGTGSDQTFQETSDEDFPVFVDCAANILNDPSFETAGSSGSYGPTKWDAIVDSGFSFSNTARTGSWSTGLSAGTRVGQTIDISLNALEIDNGEFLVRIHVYQRAAVGASGLGIVRVIYFDAPSGTQIGSSENSNPLTADWELNRIRNILVPPGTRALRFEIQKTGGSGEGLFDDAHLELQCESSDESSGLQSGGDSQGGGESSGGGGGGQSSGGGGGGQSSGGGGGSGGNGGGGGSSGAGGSSSSSEDESSLSEGPISDCDGCTGGAAMQYRLTADGFSDGDCLSCANYNGTFVCTYVDLGPTEDCTWLSEVFEGCDGGGTSQDDQWKIVMTFTGGSNKIRAFAVSDNILYEAENACCGSMTLTRQSTSNDCGAPATITVESIGPCG